ncbi:MAG: hypothetical protein IFK92_07965, partial [Acidobacteria bacterium]|nr:hypothetical protein [Candidatus Sulfomarinibacter kjeldsenii]
MNLSDDAKRLLDGANIVHLATLQPDGARVSGDQLGDDHERPAFVAGTHEIHLPNLEPFAL